MSDIGLNYDASISPSPVSVQFGLNFSANTLKATINNVDNFVAVLKPAGNVSEMILSAIADPLAQTLGVVLPPMGKHLIEGHSISIMSVSPIDQEISGEHITLTPANLQASTWNDMLMIKGDINVS